jgi:ATPase subunit of ABC transporter with duplicated ATPase domains
LAVDLAIADIVASRKASKLNVLILDEYFKDLSEVSMEKCLDLLTKRKCPVILVEHNTLFKNIVENTFFARLKDGTTTESKAD